MRILVVTPTFLPVVGGAELVILEICRRWAAKHKVCVLTPYLAEHLLKEHATDEQDGLINFDVERFEDKYTLMKIRGHRVTMGAIPPFSLSTVTAVQRSVEEFGPDVINVHYVAPTGLGVIWAGLRNRLPFVITFNGRDVPGPGVPHLWKYWHRLAARLATDVTYVSDYCRTAIFGDRKQTPGHVIFNGAPHVERDTRSDDGQLLRIEWSIPPRDKILFSIQRLNKEKRVDVVIRSFKEILKVFPETTLLVGGQGPMRTKLQELAESLEIQNRVRFLGYVPRDRLKDYFGACDVFLFHSTYETFGMVVAEAMSYGKPVVSVSNTAIPEVVADGDSGILVPSENPEAMAAAAVRLLGNEELRCKMGQSGLARARTYFSWDRIAQQYESVFEGAMRAYP
jgi:glycosyltransferase involved in cell wall biosynthesis